MEAISAGTGNLATAGISPAIRGILSPHFLGFLMSVQVRSFLITADMLSEARTPRRTNALQSQVARPRRISSPIWGAMLRAQPCLRHLHLEHLGMPGVTPSVAHALTTWISRLSRIRN